MILDRLRQKLDEGSPAFGTSIRFSDPAIIEIIGPNWDFAWIDLQHGTFDIDALPNLIRAADLVGMSSLIRLDGLGAPAAVPFVLDMDAAGVIVAQVDTPDQARSMVQVSKFPPLGNRSYGGRRIYDHHGLEYTDKANTHQLLIVQIESPDALDACGEIAAVDGVDGLMIGPDDLALRMGILGKVSLYEGPVYDAACRIAEACRNAGKYSFGFGGKEPNQMQAALDAGFDLISMGADVTYLKSGEMEFVRAVHDAAKKR